MGNYISIGKYKEPTDICSRCWKKIGTKDLRYATKSGSVCIPCDKQINEWRYLRK